MKTEKIIEVLNTLIRVNKDRLNGYENASLESQEPDLKNFFDDLAATSICCKQELTDEVRRLGGTTIKGTTLKGKLLRAWMDVKTTFKVQDKSSRLKAFECREVTAKQAYQSALQNTMEDLTKEQVTMIKTQFDLLTIDHHNVKRLRANLIAQD